MKIWIASADVDEISDCSWAPLEGIITNPSVLIRAGRDWKSTLRTLAESDWSGLRALEAIHLQAVSRDRDGILGEMECFAQLIQPKRLIAKVPVGPGGFAATPALIAQDMEVNVTGICSLSQAQVAIQAGARFVSVYVARVNDASRHGDGGFRLVADVREYIGRCGVDAQIMAASIRDQTQYEEIVRRGAHAVAATPQLIRQIVQDELTEQSMAAFQNDWENG